MENMSLSELQSHKKKLMEKYQIKKAEMRFSENIVDEEWIRNEVENLKKEIKLYSGRIAQLQEESDSLKT